MNLIINKFFALTLILIISSIGISYGNFSPTFDRGTRLNLNVCQNSNNNISSYLAITDNDTAQRIIWTSVLAPSRGSLSGLSDTGLSNRLSIMPSGVFYNPTAGYTGLDSIRVVVNDSLATDTITIVFTVRALPNVRLSNSRMNLCALADTTLTASGASTYTWAPSTGLSTTTGASVVASHGSSIVYTVIGTDTLGCQQRAYDTINRRSLPNVVATPTTLTICSGSDTTFSASGAISYTWSPASSLSASTGAIVRATPLSSSTSTITYLVTGTDSFNCSNTASISALVNPTPNAISIAAGGNPITCIGHSIALSSAPNTGTWQNSDTLIALLGTTTIRAASSSTTITGIDTGVTFVKYVLPTGCYSSKIISVHEFNYHLGVFHTCLGNDITVRDSATHATWGSYSGSAVSSVGTINVYFTYSGGCQIDYQVNVEPTPGDIEGPSEMCVGTTDTFTNAESGGTWSSSNTSVATINSITGILRALNRGTVTLTYRLPPGCDTSITLTINPLPNVFVANRSLCIGSSTSVTASGASSYDWSPAATLSASTGTTVTATPTLTTTYTVIGTDAYGCVNDTNFVITVNTPPGPPTVSTSPVYCRGAGASPLTASGTSLKWYTSATGGTGVTTLTPSTTTAGTFTYYVSQTVSGCESTRMPITVTILPLPSISITADRSSICLGNAAHLTAAGSSVSYTWSPAASLSSSSAINVTATPTTNTTYTLSGVDINGCNNSATLTVVVNSLPSITTTPATPVVCLGGALTVVASGASTYVWSPATAISATSGASVILSPTVATTYTITGTDGNGCVSTRTLPVTINASTVRPTVSSPLQYCQNASSTPLTATGTSLMWYTSRIGGTGSTTAPIPSTTTVGNVTYYVSQSYSGCESLRDSILVTVHGLPTVSVTPTSDTICLGDTTTILATGATNYSWRPTSGLIDTNIANVRVAPTSTTTYTVIGRDIHNCKDTNQTRVHVLMLPAVNISATTDTVCIGSSATLLASGATTYSWTPSTGLSSATGASVIATPTLSTTYTVTGTDINGCSKRSIDTLTVDTVPVSPTIARRVIHYCQFATPISLATNVSGNHIRWYLSRSSVGSTTIPSINTNLPDTFTFYVTQQNRVCESLKDSFVVIIDRQPTLTVSASNSSICVGDSSTIAVHGCISYNWSPTSRLFIRDSIAFAYPTATTAYTIIGTDAQGCKDTAATSITVFNLPTVSISPSTTTLCNGLSDTLSVSGSATTYTWSPTSGLSATTGTTVIITPSVTTTYTVMGTDIHGCINRATALVNVTGIPPRPSVSSPLSYCRLNNSTPLTATGTAIKWYTSTTGIGTATAFTPNTSLVDTFIYYVTQTIGGCESPFDSIIVYIKPLPNVNCSGGTTLCRGDSATLSATGATTYRWLPFSGASDTLGGLIRVSPAATTNYTVTGTAANGCTDTALANISINALPNINITPTAITICQGSTVSLTATGGISYLWNPAGSLSSSVGSVVSSNPSSTTTYTVTGTDSNGCNSTRTVMVTVNPIPLRPLVSSPVLYCQFETAVPLTALGDSLKWYTSRAGAGTSTAFTPTTSSVDTLLYYVTKTNLGCESLFDSIAVIIKPLPSITCSSSPSEICIGDTSHLTATGGINYRWFPHVNISDTSSALVHSWPSASTIYTVIGTGSNGCKKAASSTVIVHNLPLISISATRDTVCTSATTTITAIGASTYTWAPSTALTTTTGNTTVANPTSTIIYTVTGVDTNGCINSSDKLIRVNSYPGPPAVTRIRTYCQYETAVPLTATGSTLRWYTVRSGGIGSATAPTPTTSAIDTTYYYVSQNVGGCESERDSIGIIILPLPTILVSASRTAICVLDSTSLSATGASSYHWLPATGLSSTTGSTVRTSPSSTLVYTINGTGGNGCQNTASDTVVVNSLPDSIAGASHLCLGTPVTLNSTTAAGNWQSSDSTVIRMTSTGVARGISIGTATITYSIGTGCFTTQRLTVYPYPSEITGASSLCPGDTVIYRDSTFGGTWAHINASIATINTAGQLISTGPGIDTIIYTLSPGCSKKYGLVIHPLPNDIIGPTSMCLGDSIFLSNTTVGGSWSVSDTRLGTINASGNLVALASGTVYVTYTLSSGCIKTHAILINRLPSYIMGADTVCPQEQVQYTDSIAGGNWSIRGSHSAVNSAGLLSAYAPGVDTLFYSLGTGCFRSLLVRINPLPADIVGDSSICVNSDVVLTNSTPGGHWSQIDPFIDSMNNGYVMGKNAGVDTIFYTLPTGCKKKLSMHILPLPSDILGPDTLCPGTSIALTNATLGGSWMNTDTSRVTISALGIVTGITSGYDSIFYVLSTGCKKGLEVHVRPLPAVILGRDSVCELGQTTFSNATFGGRWYASNTRATINASGIITGAIQGRDTIIYALPTGCLRTKVVSILPLPSAILGTDSVCVRSSVSVFNSSMGGSWSSYNPRIATISSAGVITGISAGTDSIFYTLPTGCYTTLIFRVNPLPSPLFTDSSSCIGNPLILRDSAGRTAYVVYPSTPGIVTITLATTSGCVSNVSSMIYPNPGPIIGATGLCLGTTSTLTDSVTGGTWSVADTNIALINSSGILLARSIGTTTVTYTLSTGCFVTKRVDVNSLFNFSSYTATYPNTCRGIDGSIVLNGLGTSRTYRVDYIKDSIANYTYKYADTLGRLIIDSLSAGVYATVRVSLSGCTSNSIDTFLLDPPLPSRPIVISNSPVCDHDTLMLQAIDTTLGVHYSWSGPSSFTSTMAAPIISSHSYADSGYYVVRVSKYNCHVYDSVYVRSIRIPDAAIITGDSTLCIGNTGTLFNSTLGGNWYVKHSLLSIDRSSGAITGIRYGYDTVLYEVGNTCGNDTAFKQVFINQIPPVYPIVGANFICVGSTESYTNRNIGGRWVALNTNALISDSGMATGYRGGTDTLLYIVTNICGSDTSEQIIDIVPIPAVSNIFGPSSLCVNSTAVLTNTTLGGNWSISDASRATVNTSGVIRGISAGTVVVTYTYTNRCGTVFTLDTITILPLPDAGIIIGDSAICAGDSAQFTSTIHGGIWWTNNPSILNITRTYNDTITTIGGLSGMSYLRYIFTNTCGSDTILKAIEVKALPTLISSLTPAPVCSGSPFTYTPLSSLSGTRFTWMRPSVSEISNLAASGVDSIQETLFNASPYNVTVRYDIYMIARGCRSVQAISKIIKPIPKLYSDTSFIRCSGASVNYLPMSLTPGTSFTWVRPTVVGINPLADTGSGYISEVLFNSTSSPVDVYYFIQLSAFGCNSNQTIRVRIENNPPNAPKITTMCPPRVCQKTMYQNFGAETKPPLGVNYNWYGHNANVWATGGDRQYCLVNFPDSAMFSWVVLAATYNGNICPSKDSFAVLVDEHVSEIPEVIYSYYLFVCKWNKAETYQWGYDDRYTLDSSLIQGETNQAYLCSNPDFTHKMYWVITRHEGCMQKTYLKVPTWLNTIEDIEAENALLYPNPNDGNFMVEVKSAFNETMDITVTDAVGAIVDRYTSQTNSKYKVATSGYNGIYFVTIRTAHGSTTKKIVITK